MKVIQFSVPIDKQSSVVVSEDILPYFYNYMHRHSELQITLILKGKGKLIAGNYTQPFKPGDVYILGPNQPHIFKSDKQYFASPRPGNVHAIHIFFDYQRFLKNFMDLPELEPVNRLFNEALPGLQVPHTYTTKVALDIKAINQSHDFNRLIKLITLLQYLATEVKGWKSLSTGFNNEPVPGMEGFRMNDIFEYTLKHYDENISLKKIASLVHITPHAFCKYFKKHTRKTFVSFLHEIRINEACKKMLNNDFDNIASIAYATGFNSAINFNRVFKKMTGMSPSDYIRLYKYGSSGENKENPVEYA